MLVVPLTCPTCGAAGRHVAHSLFALCFYCGRVIARHREAIEGATEMVRRSYLALITGDEHAGRILALMHAQEAARLDGDRARFEALATESLLLELAEDPSRVPPHIPLATWARTQVALRVLAVFEPELYASFPQLSVAACEANARATGAIHLEALRAWATRLAGHPAFPVDLCDAPIVETLAFDAYRVAIGGAAAMLSATAVSEALAVLGACAIAEGATCRTCGGHVTTADASAGACAWCRSAIDADGEHPWVVALARIASAPLVVPRPPLERAQIALQILASNVMTTRKRAPPALVEAYLRATVPDVDRVEIDRAWSQLRSLGMPI